MQKALLTILVVLINSLSGQCEGTPSDPNFEVSQCDSGDMQILQQIISLNGLTEWTNPIDGDNGDGNFEPQELGYQVWTNGRITTLNVGSYLGGGGLWIIAPYGINVLPESIGNLSMVHSLLLWFNALNELPQSIGSLSKLSHLQVSANELTSLPGSLVNLDSLQYLLCYGNEIASLPPGIENLSNLVQLDIGANQFTELPIDLWNLDNIENMNLSGNQISVLSDSISQLTGLERLNLSFNNLSILPQSLSNLIHLNTVQLDSNYLYCSEGSVDTSAIPAFLTDGSISNVSGLYDQKCGELSWLDYTSYLPLQVGNAWNYGYGWNTINHISYISDSLNVNDTIYYTYRDSAIFPISYSNQKHICWDSTGLLLYQNNEPWIDFTQPVGDTLVWHSALDTNRLRYQIIISDTTTIVTPMGIFENCLTVMFDSPNVTDDRAIYTFAPSIGIVHFYLDYHPPHEGQLVSAIIDGHTLGTYDQEVAYNYRMIQNFPNPFNPITTIRYELPERSFVRILVYDVMGKEVTTLASEMQEPGLRFVRWDATNIASGVYFYRIMAGEFFQTKKMLLLK